MARGAVPVAEQSVRRRNSFEHSRAPVSKEGFRPLERGRGRRSASSLPRFEHQRLIASIGGRPALLAFNDVTMSTFLLAAWFVGLNANAA
jgi:hypothetical protein